MIPGSLFWLLSDGKTTMIEISGCRKLKIQRQKTMTVKLEKFKPHQSEELITFLTSYQWPFHGTSKPLRSALEKLIADGFFISEESETFWLMDENNHKIGIIRLYDLQDDTPVFDIRINPEIQGQGYGTQAIALLCKYVFSSLMDKRRLEGYTRADNKAMINVFKKCHFAKEAHHRDSWPDDNGKYYDSVGYTILKSDWENNTITPVLWNE